MRGSISQGPHDAVFSNVELIWPIVDRLKGGDRPLLSEAVSRLLEIADRPKAPSLSTSETSDDPRSHALHIMKSLVHDAQLAVDISRYGLWKGGCAKKPKKWCKIKNQRWDFESDWLLFHFPIWHYFFDCLCPLSHAPHSCNQIFIKLLTSQIADSKSMLRNPTFSEIGGISKEHTLIDIWFVLTLESSLSNLK